MVAWKNAFFLQEKPMSIKFLVLGGGGILGFGGGGECRFYFNGRADFSEKLFLVIILAAMELSLRAKGTLISEPRFSTPREMRFLPREKGKMAFLEGFL